MYHLYLGLGSNLGDRKQNLQTAVERLSKEMHVRKVSPIYETEAWGVTDQPEFLNLCLAARSTRPPWPMLRLVKQIEVDLGREPTFRWGPRLIDIDILIYEELVVRSAGLNVPHSGLADRASVLVPLDAIAPDLCHPLLGKRIWELRLAVDDSGVRPFP
ncbi:MAG: 2-amino-4-hydroxy-6-hydroxymethyldihydropteridine diphosphokinase [Candidatus Promineifilaceae bacterium]